MRTVNTVTAVSNQISIHNKISQASIFQDVSCLKVTSEERVAAIIFVTPFVVIILLLFIYYCLVTYKLRHIITVLVQSAPVTTTDTFSRIMGKKPL